MGAPHGIGVRLTSAMAFTNFSERWQPGFLGTPNPATPNLALGVPGFTWGNAYQNPAPTVYPGAQVMSASKAEAAAFSVVVTKPTGVVDGDLLIAFIRAITPNIDPDTPAGWTSHVVDRPVNSLGRLRVCYKIASGEPADYTFTAPSASIEAQVVRVQGHDPVTPLEPNIGVNTGFTTTRTGASFRVYVMSPLFIQCGYGTGTVTNPAEWTVISDATTVNSVLHYQTRACTEGGGVNMTQSGAIAYAMAGIAVRPSKRPPWYPTTPPTLDNANTSRTSAHDGASLNLTGFTVNAGSDRLLIVAIGVEDNNFVISSVTWNGVSMTQFGGSIGAEPSHQHKLFYLVNPATGNNTLALTFSGALNNGEIAVGFVSLRGVNQTTPLNGSLASASSLATNPSLSMNITTIENGYPLAFMFSMGASTISITSNAGQTRLANSDFANINAVAIDTKTPPLVTGVNSMGAAYGVTTPVSSTQLGVAVNPVPGVLTAEKAIPPINYIQNRFQHLAIR